MDVRERAIEEHDRTAGLFETMYEEMRQDAYYSAFTYGRKKIDEFIDEQLRLVRAGGKILDAGCGTGEQVKRLRERGFEVVGIEPAGEMRSKAQQRNPGVEIKYGLVTEIPYGDEEFDGVICIEVLRYLDRGDNLQAYKEMLRVTKPGGRIIVSLVNLWALDGFYVYDKVHHLVNKIMGKEAPIHCEYVTPWGVRRDLARLTGSRVEFHGRMIGPLRIVYKVCRPLGAWCARRCERLDDWISRQGWSVPFAGHLMLVIVKT
ncbi:MAG: class I SAM-dependent methyltransferase [bacterium]|nr:class I SAM-dependent methyltransferase [bacterium]